MTNHVTLGELVKYVLENRKGKAFENYTEEQIAYDIYTAAKTNTLLYAVDSSTHKVCGIITCGKEQESNLMFVYNFLTSEPWVIKSFVREFAKRYPDYSLAGLRFGQEKHYNTSRLVRYFTKGELL